MFPTVHRRDECLRANHTTFNPCVIHRLFYATLLLASYWQVDRANKLVFPSSAGAAGALICLSVLYTNPVLTQTLRLASLVFCRV